MDPELLKHFLFKNRIQTEIGLTFLYSNIGLSLSPVGYWPHVADFIPAWRIFFMKQGHLRLVNMSVAPVCQRCTFVYSVNLTEYVAMDPICSIRFSPILKIQI